MVFLYKMMCVAVVVGFLLATAQGSPILNLFSSSVGAQKGASQFHK
jgi:hypothetical protein